MFVIRNTNAEFNSSNSWLLKLTICMLVALIAVSGYAGTDDYAVNFLNGKYQVTETQANTFTKSLQDNACLAADSAGNILVVWESRRQEVGTYGVVGQLFDQFGRRIGNEFRVNQYVHGVQHEPAVAFDTKNNIAWIVWESMDQDGDSAGIYMRRFMQSVDGSMLPLSDETLVNQTTKNAQLDPAVTVNSRGDALITWCERNNDNINTQRAMGRIYNNNTGKPFSDEFALNDFCDGQDRFVNAANLQVDNKFAVVWDRIDKSGNPEGIYLRFINNDGSFVSETKHIASAESAHNYPIEPVINSAAEINNNNNNNQQQQQKQLQDHIVITWMAINENGNGYDVMAQRFNDEGNAIGKQIIVSPFSGSWQSGAAVAVRANGSFIVSYNVFGKREQIKLDDEQNEIETETPADIMAQVFDVNDLPQGVPVSINQTVEGKQTLGVASNANRLIWNADNNSMACAWDGNIENDQQGIGLTVFTPADIPIPDMPANYAANTGVPAGNELAIADVRLNSTVTSITADPIMTEHWVPQERELLPASVGPDYGFIGFTTTEYQPPDPDIAVGPEHIVGVVNMRIAIFDKAGNELYNDYLENFWGELGADYWIFDPVAQYDHLAQRFVVVAGEHEANIKTKSRLDIAVSKTSNPMDGWHKYRFNLEAYGDYFDFENLGIGTDAYYVASDYFDGAGSRLHIMEKAPMLVGDPVSINFIQIEPTKSISMGPLDMIDDDAPAHYMISSFSGYRTLLKLYAVTEPFAVPPTIVTYNVPVAWFDLPPDATQKDSTRLLPTLDFRIKHGVYRHGSIWVAHTVGEEDTARTRWYEIDMKGWPASGDLPAVKQWGVIDLGVDQHNWFQDIGVDAEGDVAIACNRSSLQDYPFVSRFVHKVNDAPGTVRQEVRMMESNGAHTGTRWGDYGGIDEDPAEPGVFWNHHEYNDYGKNWRTWVGRFDTDQSMVLEIPAELVRGELAQFNLYGTAANGMTHLVYSIAGPGSTYVPALDVTLDIKKPKLGLSTIADANGYAEFRTVIPNSVPPGLSLWFQCAEFGNTSNLVEAVVN